VPTIYVAQPYGGMDAAQMDVTRRKSWYGM
jgi:hypothetical protein